jgi:cytochrome c553
MRSCLALTLLTVGACSPEGRPTPSPFASTGEIIALSGGMAGAKWACFRCHGLNGQGNGAGAPRLAGLGTGYMARQLDYYAGGLRQNEQMHLIAKQLSWSDRMAVSAYYDRMRSTAAAGIPPTPQKLYHEGDAARGIQSCAACHGARGEGVGLGNPPLAGQPAPYLAAQHFAWREGRRYGDPLDVMLTISRRMTKAEIMAVSAYAAVLPGATARPGSMAASPPAHRADPRSDASAPPRYAAE